MEDDYWPRLREALRPYDRYGEDAYDALFRDLLMYFKHQQVDIEIRLVSASVRAGVYLRTGTLRIEQEVFSNSVRKLHGE